MFAINFILSSYIQNVRKKLFKTYKSNIFNIFQFVKSKENREKTTIDISR